MPMIVFISLYQHSIVEIKHNIHYIFTNSYIINLISKHEKSIRGGDVRERISSLYLFSLPFFLLLFLLVLLLLRACTLQLSICTRAGYLDAPLVAVHAEETSVLALGGEHALPAALLR